ncbi:hypothetical protein O181_126847, partial [Austropuccinia psidii MF-1]|nr:hypothetical protein [Austropuccinia psidii MF-1]
MDAPALASPFLDRFVRYHGFHKRIITDCGSSFVSTFWRNVCTKLGTKPTPSTAYHLQTDGQTEQMNQMSEEYLRHFCSYCQENWVDLLPLAELCLNNTTANSTGFSPFFLWQGFHPWVNALLGTSLVPSADKSVRLLSDSQKQALSHLAKARELHAKYYNRGRHQGISFQAGETVLLSR